VLQTAAEAAPIVAELLSVSVRAPVQMEEYATLQLKEYRKAAKLMGIIKPRAPAGSVMPCFGSQFVFFSVCLVSASVSRACLCASLNHSDPLTFRAPHVRIFLSILPVSGQAAAPAPQEGKDVSDKDMARLMPAG
jgi:hypothetical protein